LQKNIEKPPFRPFLLGSSLNTDRKRRNRSTRSEQDEKMEMNEKGMVAEAIGSLAITLLVWGTIAGEDAAPHTSAVMAGAAGVTLAIMWMTFKGSEILPIITIGNMAAGRTDWQTGALNFCMQILGGLVGAAVLAWQGETVFEAADAMTATSAVTALIGGFLMMTVWDRLGGGWESGAFAAVLIVAGVVLASASSLGGTIVDGHIGDTDNFIAVFGTMIVGGIGAAASLMLGDQIFEEE
jgi:glycerol uptake facilitator-like aquaporin